MLEKFSAIHSSYIFSGPFSLSFPYGTPIMQILKCLTLSRGLLGCVHFSLILCSIFGSIAVISTFLSSIILSSTSHIYSAWVILLWIPSTVDTVLFISVCLFLSSSKYLVNTCTFSTFLTNILIHLHYHYSEFFFWKVAYLYFI